MVANSSIGKVNHPLYRSHRLTTSPVSPSSQLSPTSTSTISPTARIAVASCRTSRSVTRCSCKYAVTSALQTALWFLRAARGKALTFRTDSREKVRADRPEHIQDQIVEDCAIMHCDLNDNKNRYTNQSKRIIVKLFVLGKY